MSIVEYLKNIINRKENLKDILLKYIQISDSTAGAIFIRDYDNVYNCLEHIQPENEQIINTPSIITSEIITNISIDITIYSSLYKVNNILSIPIIISSDIIGLVSVVNRPGIYSEEIIDELIEQLSPYIALTQLILHKEKIINEFKNKVHEKTIGNDLFLANMSHEIRTPANGVIGYGQLLMQTDLNQTQKGYIMAQNQCCIQLMQIINDILDFSKLSAGKMNIINECFSLYDMIDTIKGTIISRIEEKKQTLRFTLDDNIEKFIISDKHKIIQVLLNLIVNANKFTNIGGFIDVNLYTSKNILKIIVKDNGIGISTKDQSKLFNAFEQLNANIYKSGTGLGLVICQKITRLLGGDINVISNIGLGSSFTVTFKYKHFEEYKKDIEKDSILLKDKIILVVDDNTDNRILLSEMLFEWQMKPIICASPLEALRLILGNRYNFSLGLIDICMPNISGTELAKQIKEEKPFFPLIALSSLDTFIKTQEFEAKLDKPINKVQLFNIIYKVLSNNIEKIGFIGNNPELSTIIDNSNKIKLNYDMHILIVEDIIYNRTLLENMMFILGYKNIESTDNGKTAIEMINKAQQNNNPYQTILLDLRMPIMDGYDVINFIKENKLDFPRIVVITASVMEEDLLKCKNLGINYFLTKPIELHCLKEVMLNKQKNICL